MNKFNLSIISLIATIIGYFMLESEYYAQIPTAFGFDIQEHNIIVSIIGGIVLLILWLIVVIFLWCLSMYFFVGMVFTPVLFFSAIFSKPNKTTKYNSRNTNSKSSDYSYSNTESGTHNNNNNNNNNTRRNSNNKTNNKKRFILGKDGSYIDSETGKFLKRDFLDTMDIDSGQKIDLETGEYYEDTLLGYQKTDAKMNLENGKMYKDSLLGYQETGTRVNQETGEIEKDGLFGWTKTDERINPKTGKRQDRDILGGWKNKD